jgi:hypothetical protein
VLLDCGELGRVGLSVIPIDEVATGMFIVKPDLEQEPCARGR